MRKEARSPRTDALPSSVLRRRRRFEKTMVTPYSSRDFHQSDTRPCGEKRTAWRRNRRHDPLKAHPKRPVLYHTHSQFVPIPIISPFGRCQEQGKRSRSTASKTERGPKDAHPPICRGKAVPRHFGRSGRWEDAGSKPARPLLLPILRGGIEPRAKHAYAERKRNGTR